MKYYNKICITSAIENLHLPLKWFDTFLAFPVLLVSALVLYLLHFDTLFTSRCKLISFICTLVCVSFSALFTSPVPSSRPPLPTEALIYRQKRFLSKRSHFMRCIEVRKGIFNNHLTTLWQSMQSCPEESNSIKIYR